MSYKNLEIWQLVKQLVIDIHKITLSELPKFEMVELLTSNQLPETLYFNTIHTKGNLIQNAPRRICLWHDSRFYIDKRFNIILTFLLDNIIYND